MPKIKYLSNTILQIERDDGKREALKVSGKLSIRNLAPLSEVVVYYYSNFPYIPRESIALTHDKGLGEISFHHPVPRLVTQTSGFWVSYYWSTIVLACLLGAGFLFFGVRWLKKR
jgi:hypothetical protein